MVGWLLIFLVFSVFGLGGNTNYERGIELYISMRLFNVKTLRTPVLIVALYVYVLSAKVFNDMDDSHDLQMNFR